MPFCLRPDAVPLPPSIPGPGGQPSILIQRTDLNHGEVQPTSYGSRTPREPECYNTRVRHLGQYQEIVHSRVGWYRGGSRPAPSSREQEVSPERLAENRARTLRRTCSQVRRLVLAYDLCWLTTLTFADEVTGWERAWKYFENFIRRARRTWGAFHYVAVMAIQEERAATTGVRVWHFHLALPERVDREELGELWGWGGVDCLPLPDEHGVLEPLRVARYLQENLKRSAGEPGVTGKRYRAAQGMKIDSEDFLIDEADLDARLADQEVVYDIEFADWTGRTALVKLEPGDPGYRSGYARNGPSSSPSAPGGAVCSAHPAIDAASRGLIPLLLQPLEVDSGAGDPAEHPGRPLTDDESDPALAIGDGRLAPEAAGLFPSPGSTGGHGGRDRLRPTDLALKPAETPLLPFPDRLRAPGCALRDPPGPVLGLLRPTPNYSRQGPQIGVGEIEVSHATPGREAPGHPVSLSSGLPAQAGLPGDLPQERKELFLREAALVLAGPEEVPDLEGSTGPPRRQRFNLFCNRQAVRIENRFSGGLRVGGGPGGLVGGGHQAAFRSKERHIGPRQESPARGARGQPIQGASPGRLSSRPARGPGAPRSALGTLFRKEPKTRTAHRARRLGARDDAETDQGPRNTEPGCPRPRGAGRGRAPRGNSGVHSPGPLLSGRERGNHGGGNGSDPAPTPTTGRKA